MTHPITIQGSLSSSPGRVSLRRTWLTAAGLLLLVGLALPVQAEVASLAQAEAFTLSARGVDAPNWNPATLAWAQTFDLRLLSFQAALGNNSLSLDDYNKYNGATWTNEDKGNILGLIPGGTLDADVHARVEGLGFALHGAALTFENRVEGSFKLSREYARLLLYGNTPGETYDFSGTAGSARAWTEGRLSYGRDVYRLHIPAFAVFGARLIPRTGDAMTLSAGASLKYLHGWGYAEITEARGSFVTSYSGILGSASFAGRTAEGGSGQGLDLGVAARTQSGWSLALGLHDVGSSIKWTKNPKLRTGTAQADTVTSENLQHAADLVTHSDSTETIASFKETLPTVLTFALGHEWGRSSVELDLRNGSSSNKPGTSTRARAALGGCYSPWGWLDLHAGFARGGAESKMASAGVGFHLFGALRLNLAAASVGTWDFFSPKGLGLGMDLGVRL